MVWHVRTPTAADADAIARINVDGWRHAYAGLMPAALLDALEIEPRADRLRERYRTATSADGLLAVDEQDVVAGYCWFGDYRVDDDAPDPGPGWAEIYALYVDPVREGQGVGGTLLRAALDAVAPRPVALWVLEGNVRARGFYERFGFVPDGDRADFDAGGTPVPELRYRLTRSGRSPGA